MTGSKYFSLGVPSTSLPQKPSMGREPTVKIYGVWDLKEGLVVSPGTRGDRGLFASRRPRGVLPRFWPASWSTRSAQLPSSCERSQQSHPEAKPTPPSFRQTRNIPLARSYALQKFFFFFFIFAMLGAFRGICIVCVSLCGDGQGVPSF